MLKIFIIIFLCIIVIIDIVPKVKRYLEMKEKMKKRKTFGEKMKQLEIK